MTQHILPNDQYNHIQDVACGCNPIVTIVEGEEMCLHNFRSKDVEPLRKLAKKLKAKQIEEAPEEVEEIPLKNMEEVSRFLEEI